MSKRDPLNVAYDAMLAALRDCDDWITTWCEIGPAEESILEKIRGAIAQAEAVGK